MCWQVVGKYSTEGQMTYWLVKSEPDVFGWDDFVREGKTSWDGVRSYAARGNLKAMQKGDKVLFYHSNRGLCITGIARVSKSAYPDPTSPEGQWHSVELAPLKALRQPVTLAQIKAEPRLKDLELVRIGRLSVSKVSPVQWTVILELGKTHAAR
ncbi:MAG TPA: EVE domain-containing protein [Chitinophagaceae bacterium]|nr:EVE domain-containing protein [Chitinophagaceae bacterium]